MHDPSDDVGQLYDEMVTAQQRYGAAQEKLGAVTGRDGHGVIGVTLDPSGRISAIAVTGAWRDHYAADTIGGGVAEAATAAATARAQQWGQLVAEEDDQPRQRVPLPPLHDTLAGQLADLTRSRSSEQGASTMRALHDLLTEVNAAIDDITVQVRDQVRREYVGTSSSGRVRATLLGNGSLQNLELDRHWGEQAHGTNVGRESLEAVHDAYRRLASEDVESIVERSPIGRMRRLSQDPVALAREVGLRD